ncbi:MAG: anhydro-N-acetylmuramic acid kinase [Flavobacteriales bacterium]|nr:anhydro-N-acetylmuramic acid kinase [Flavobacteriales bacterium]
MAQIEDRHTGDNLVVAGLMSGTSLDGLDVAIVQFRSHPAWGFELLAANTFPYPGEWLQRLENAFSISGPDLVRLHTELGTYMGQVARAFIDSTPYKVDLIASHGHTLFHDPAGGMTFQAGHLSYLSAAAGMPVAGDFRSLDVALGGQGAPLVPIGDRMLFGQYDYCLNLGGFANISFEQNGKRVACDTGPCNMALNELAQRLGGEFDRGGAWAATGRLDEQLLMQMNGLPYFTQPLPKSLGREWYVNEFQPLIKQGETADLLRTCTEHIARQVSSWVKPGASLLITGGGAFNTFLVERIGALSHANVVIPDSGIVQFKEAIVFALLGALRWRGEINCLASVTGAKRDSCSGEVAGLFKIEN